MASHRSPGSAWDSLQAQLALELAPDLEIIRKIGGGGATAVFLAREPALQRLVAIKVLRPTRDDDEKARARFTREACAIARISHPNVVSLFRIGTVLDEVPFVVMQFVRGESLADRLKRNGPLPVGMGRDVLRSIASALDAAHSRGILHRDLNPTNVLLATDSGQTYLTDFGLALLLGDAAQASTRLTTEGHVVGNLRYLSPEQVRGREPDQKADIWGLGILAWETLTGQGPFDSDSLSETLKAGMEAELPSLASRVSGLTAREFEILGRCLNRTPERRPSAADIVREMEQVRGRSRAGAGPIDSAASEAVGNGVRVGAEPAEAPLVLRTLGGLDLEARRGTDVRAVLRQPKRMALLVLLAQGGESSHLSRDRLVGLLWAESSQARGRQALRQSLYVIRRFLGTELFAELGDAQVGIRPGELICDVAEFQRQARAGQAEAAMQWYRGDFLPGFFVSDAVEFERWLDTERLRLRRLAAQCCWELADQSASAAEPGRAGRWARRAADLTPFDEAALHRLIVLLDALGDRAGALKAYDHFARRLLEEYAAQPSPETTALIGRVRARD